MLTISLKRSESCGWNVCRRDTALFSNLTLEQAIRLARVVACDEHLRLRQSIQVDMPGNHHRIVLAHYTRLDGDCAGRALAA